MRMALCHPNLKNHAANKCRKCYTEEYNKNNVDKLTESYRRFAKTTKGKYNQLKRKAKSSKRALDITFEQYCDLIQNPCHYCGGVLPDFGYGLDRTNNLLDYTLDNVVTYCKECNLIKGHWLSYNETVIVIKALHGFRSLNENSLLRA
jgi:hypothetical protein